MEDELKEQLEEKNDSAGEEDPSKEKVKDDNKKKIKKRKTPEKSESPEKLESTEPENKKEKWKFIIRHHIVLLIFYN